MRRLTLLFALCVSILGSVALPTQAQNKSGKSAPSPVKGSPDVVALFKEMVEKAARVKTYTGVYHIEKQNKWARTYAEISNIEFDIKKTDSLVTPEIGIVKFVHIGKRSPTYDQKELAESTEEVYSPEFYAYTRDEYTIRYTFVDGKWVAKDLHCSSELLPEKPGFRSSLGKIEISKPNLDSYKQGEHPLVDRWVVQ